MDNQTHQIAISPQVKSAVISRLVDAATKQIDVATMDLPTESQDAATMDLALDPDFDLNPDSNIGLDISFALLFICADGPHPPQEVRKILGTLAKKVRQATFLEAQAAIDSI